MRGYPVRHFHIVVPLIVMGLATPAFAHGDDEQIPRNFHELWHTWAFDPGIVIPLVLSAWLYLQGVVRMWSVSGIGHGISKWEAGCFAGGWFALIVALVSPLHPWGGALFSAHMAQHEILMLIAAPLIVLGRPMIAFLKALPGTWAGALARAGNIWWWQKCWRFITNAMVAWLIDAVVLWVWHAPALMDAVLENPWVHALQHLSFFLSAVLFWWAVVHGPRRALGYGMAVLYMFTAAMHNGLLGVLLTFAGRLWYLPYAHSTQSWGLTPIEDQQLGGIIMWIPACTVYIVAGLALLAGWLRESESRRNKRDAVLLTNGLAVAQLEGAE
jgi:cytochrome c oxidase assembly factor CtaG